eukprot:CAMPEP_0202080922 /NCGR_PEP_ID=MMETSP0964-20121228/11186_1 /ASSEMBLY_ACC=CAM_ASM_000500 /TAXON_ID=4773 /ORGANISM="Schizochytrium aggregatum, Strain ATCC28209" /LENGTH=63 /DNA_ID=CAMNT_0048648413 /DNA_START=447 /DNA_END=638 /DNA_ORIENTATION=-
MKNVVAVGTGLGRLGFAGWPLAGACGRAPEGPFDWLSQRARPPAAALPRRAARAAARTSIAAG